MTFHDTKTREQDRAEARASYIALACFWGPVALALLALLWWRW